MRDDLCEVLHDAVNDRVDFLFDDSTTSLPQDDTGVDVTFTRAAPRRFDLVIGADGVGSDVRRIAFGPDEQFLRVLGDQHIAVFGMPNFLGLDAGRCSANRKNRLSAQGLMSVSPLQRDSTTPHATSSPKTTGRRTPGQRQLGHPADRASQATLHPRQFGPSGAAQTRGGGEWRSSRRV
jgi:2-polyprenyl-6-methoxyphenol hydroxylase-like FAD-dependent oxidoreductase